MDGLITQRATGPFLLHDFAASLMGTRGSNLLCDRRGNRRSVQSFSSPSFLLKLEEDSNSSLLSALEAQKNSNPLFCTQIPFLYGPSPF
ncbi:hypothetical protein VNO77_27546 [Canavalia gladiata]|uniref:Uncharacterized protein n=1 Tax=Canavalia gladiata TaxID=3824 RepID=A0AAN9Q487_CANGL